MPPTGKEEEAEPECINEVEWEGRKAALAQFRLAQHVYDLYSTNLSGRHRRQHLVDWLLHNLPAGRYISPFEGMHVLLTAARMVSLGQVSVCRACHQR